MPRDPDLLTRVLLQGVADEIEPLVVWPDRATYRVTAGGQRFVVKTDDDLGTVAHEIAGHRRAAAAGVRVPELVASAHDAFAMRWVDGCHAARTIDARRVARRRRAATHRARPRRRPSVRNRIRRFQSRRNLRGVRSSSSSPKRCSRTANVISDSPPMRPLASAPRCMPPDRCLDAPPSGGATATFSPITCCIDPATDRVAAIIDWADHGSGDIGWDVAVLTIDHESSLDAFLDGLRRERRAARRARRVAPALLRRAAAR